MSGTERLSMLDEFGGRKALDPAEVKGRYRRWRDRVYFVLLIIFLALPWITINGLQAVLFDIPGRRFEVFGMLFMAHDAPLLFFLLSAFVLGLAFVTSRWGRVWCGWACPQTVFIEGVYRRIERWVEGGYIERRRLRQEPWSARKARLWLTKWFLFFAISSLFSHSFIAYFSGGTRLIEMMQGSPAQNWTYFLLVSTMTALLMFDFGWFREQFCIIMCPYGRFQGVLMDAKTKNVFYDKSRGEPRKGLPLDGQEQGDCVSCNRCVHVCPTGIDIRNGLQMECIACTACIDACDEIMTKVKKPTGLISYRAETDSGKIRQNPRTLAYAALAALSIVGLLYNVLNHSDFSSTVLRAKDTPYQEMTDGLVLNHFKAHLMNQSQFGQEFEIGLVPEAVHAGLQLKQAAATTALRTGQTAEVHFFLLVPRSQFNSRGELHTKVRIVEKISGVERELDVTAVGPYSSAGS